MAKPEYHEDQIVRVQVVKGGTIELHGKFAGDVLACIKDLAWCDLAKSGAGHFVLKLDGQALHPVTQRSLSLDDKKKPSKKVEPHRLLANIAPSEDMMKEFDKALVGSVIRATRYDEDTGEYVVEFGVGGKKNRVYELSFITCKIVEQSKKVTPKINPIGKTTVVKKENRTSAPNLTVCLYEALAGEDGKNMDRWNYLTENGCSDKELATHVNEVWGQTGGNGGTLRGIACRWRGGKTQEFEFKPGLPGTAKVTGKDLIKAVREAFSIKVASETKKKTTPAAVANASRSAMDCLRSVLVGDDNENLPGWDNFTREGSTDAGVLKMIKLCLGKTPIAAKINGVDCEWQGDKKPYFLYDYLSLNKVEIKGKTLVAMARDAFKIERSKI